MSGFPQLDFTTYPSQIFWLGVTFTSLYFAVSKRVLPAISGVMENRQTKLHSDVKRAEELHSQAAQLKHEYEASLEASRRKAHKLLVETSDKIAKMQDDRNHRLEESLASQIGEAEARLQDLRDQAFAEMEKVAMSAAEEILSKFIGKRVSNSDIKRHLKVG